MPITWMSRAAKAVLAAAYEHTRSEASRTIREEHLLAALLDGAALPRQLAPLAADETRADVFEQISRNRRSGGFTRAQQSAMSTSLGVDLERVLAAATNDLGEDALDERTTIGGVGVGRYVSSGTATVLAAAERLALAAGTRTVDVEHLAIALATTPGVVAEALGDHGVSADD